MCPVELASGYRSARLLLVWGASASGVSGGGKLRRRGGKLRRRGEKLRRRGEKLRRRGERSRRRGEQSDPRTAENASQNQSFIQLIGRKRVYPLSPLLGGGFPKEGGDACSTVNSCGAGGGCAARGRVSKPGCVSTFSRLPPNFRLGANNPTPGLRKARPKTNHLFNL